MDEEKGGFLAKHLKYFTEKVFPVFKDLTDNEEFRSRLDKAGGMISLIAIGLEIYDSIQKNIKTDEDRAFNSLIRIVFATTKELLDGISKKYLKGQEIEIDLSANRKKDMLQSLFTPSEEYSDQDSFSYLSSHLLITRFKSSVISQLKEKYQNSNEEQIITHFEEKFEPLFETNIEDDTNIKKIDEIVERMNWYKERKEYLNYVKNECEKDSIKDLEKEPLDGHHYIENREAVLADKSEWNYSDKEILGKYPNIHRDDAEKIIDTFLRGSIAWRELFVGAPFGMGKTTLVKKIASKYAKESLESSIQYIPIIVFLKKRLRNVYRNLDLNGVFELIIAPDKVRNQKAFNRKILLILDGLDDYEDEANQDVKIFMEKIRTDFLKYHKLKVIVTTRLKDEIPAKLDIGREYLRLLPFSMQQLKDFFEHYNIRISHDKLQDISPGLAEEITNPLLAWMLSNIYPLIQDDLQGIIKSKDKLTGNMAKSLIYLNFFHYIIRGQYAFPLTEEKNELYFYEKKMLRALAVLKQIYGDELREEKVNQSQEIFGYLIDTSKFDKILDSYFYVKPKKFVKIIDFVHKTFKEYLLAEYYVGCLLDKIRWMNIGIPSKETVEFLGGLFELLNTDNQKIRKFIESNIENEISLANSFEPMVDDDVKEKIIETSIKSIDDVKEKIIETSIKSINQEQKIFSPHVNKDEKNEGGQITISIDTYENLSIPGWISLFALDILAPGLYPRDNKDKEKLVKLIRHPNNNVPAELKKLKKVDLSDAYLADVNLADVDLSGADLSKANLSNINLSGANLSAAKLLKADLSDARLHKTNLSKADLSDATLRYANLSKADLRGAILRYADLSNATVSEADLTEAKIENAILTRINLFKANLSKANLTHANLSLCDLTHANLTEAILTNTRLFSATLFKANLSKAKLSNAYLARSTLTDANLREVTIYSTDFLSTNLSYADISNCKLYSAIISGRLTYYGLRCMKADFNKATVENKELIDYLQKNGAANVIKSEQTPEEDKTNERQENIKPDLTETSDQVETKKIGLKLLQSAEQEIFITFSRSNEVNNIEDEDVIQIINEGENHAQIRIQSPVKELIVERHLKNSIV